MTDEEKRTALADIYAQIPDVACKGLCHASCALVPVFPIERVRMEMYSGVKYTLSASGGCGYLTTTNRCGVYAVRPFICRLYAAINDSMTRMQCPHGCRPDRPLSNIEAHALMERVKVLSDGEGASAPEVLWWDRRHQTVDFPSWQERKAGTGFAITLKATKESIHDD